MPNPRLEELSPRLTALAHLPLSAPSLDAFRRTLRDWSLLALLESAGFATIGEVGSLTVRDLHALPEIGVQNGDDIVDLLARVAGQLGDEADGQATSLQGATTDEGGDAEQTGFAVRDARSSIAGPSEKTLGQRFPNLEAIADVPLDDPVLRGAQFEPGDEVSHLWLRRTGARAVGDLLDLRPQDFLDLRGMGPTKLAKLHDYVSRLAGAAVGIRSALTQPDDDERQVQSEAERSEDRADLGLVIEWARTIGGATTWGTALEIRHSPVPVEVDAALQRLLESALPAADESSAVARFLADDARRARILADRVLTNEPRTLQELADELGVTRERVRQLETKALVSLQAAFETDPAWRPVRWAVERLRQQAGSIAPSDTLPAALPAWPSDEHQLIAFLAGYKTDPPRMLLAGTILPGLQDLPILEGTAYVVDEFELTNQLETLGVLPRFSDFAISSIGSLARIDGQLVVWRGSAVEKAIAVLELRDEPQDIDELVLAVTGDALSRSMRNRMFEDTRIMRVTKTKVGLRRWGGAQYTTVAELMRDRLASGPMDLDDLAEELAERYEVSPASVHMYGAAPMFKVTGTTIALRSLRDPYVPRDKPSKVKGLYRDRVAAITVWCLTVDSDMLRGSGRAVPQEIAVDLGIKPGGRIDLHTELADVPLAWTESSNQGPQIGSIRELVEATAAREGDPIVLRFHCQARSLEVRAIENVDAGATRSEQITGWTTLPTALTSDLEGLAEAVAVEPHEVINVLESRGDVRIAALARGLRLKAYDSPSIASGAGNAHVRPGPEATSATFRHSVSGAPEADDTFPQAGEGLEAPHGLKPTHTGQDLGHAAPQSGESERQPSVLADEFEAAIVNALGEMRGAGYDPKALRRLVSAVGARRASEMLVGLPEPSESFVALYHLDRLDLSVEAHVACEPFRDMFDRGLVDAAVARLAEHDFSVDE